MATPETLSVELDPFAPSYDGALGAVESEENQIVEAETRDLPVYGFDSQDKTWVGIGSSDSGQASQVPHFDSSDRTLVGIGPAERARAAQRAQARAARAAEAAELASHSLLAETAPEDVPMPQSEAPGPFIAGGDDEDAPDHLPMRKAEPWVLAVSAVLVVAASFALVRGVVPRTSARRLHSAATVPSLPAANETRTRQVQLEIAAATPPEIAARPALASVSSQREKPPELAPQRVTAKAVGTEQLGALDVTSNPPAGLVLDGRPMGKAPRAIQLPSGPHTVLFVHPERGRVSVTVNVRAGRTTVASADF